MVRSRSQSKLTDREIEDIFLSEDRTDLLAERFGVSNSTINSIKRQNSHREITLNLGEPGFPKNSKRKPLTPSMVKSIFEFRGSASQIKEKFGVSIEVARNIKYGNTYYHITCDLGDAGEIIIHGLDWDDVCEIRSSDQPAAVLADHFDLTVQTIYNIRNERTRKFT